jgi:hypothetical protein
MRVSDLFFIFDWGRFCIFAGAVQIKLRKDYDLLSLKDAKISSELLLTDTYLLIVIILWKGYIYGFLTLQGF